MWHLDNRRCTSVLSNRPLLSSSPRREIAPIVTTGGKYWLCMLVYAYKLLCRVVLDRLFLGNRKYCSGKEDAVRGDHIFILLPIVKQSNECTLMTLPKPFIVLTTQNFEKSSDITASQKISCQSLKKLCHGDFAGVSVLKIVVGILTKKKSTGSLTICHEKPELEWANRFHTTH